MMDLLTTEFGNSEERIKNALDSLQSNNGILLVDDEDRENEGDLIFPAETISVSQMAMLIRECSGIVCLCMTKQKIDQLNLKQMVSDNTSKYQTAFTVSIEAASGVTTGVSASDRVTTIHTAVKADCKKGELCSPGHVFPLCAKEGGVFTRKGHTEGTVDLMKLAGHKPAGILCELTNPDGSMAKLPEIVDFAKKNNLPVVSIEDIIQYRKLNGKLV